MVNINHDDIASLPADQLAFISAEKEWLDTARDTQILPISGWNIIVSKSGRGAGKTRTGASWIRREAGLYPGIVLHVVAPSHADLVGTILQGQSGLLSITPPELIESVNLSAAIPVVKFKNGSLVRGFSAQSPERLRGPQCTKCWSDECAAWGANGPETLTQIDMSTRIAFRASSGKFIQPQKFYTSTPKALQWFADLCKRADKVITDSTHANKANLAQTFIDELEIYRGTNIYRQEVLGELIDVAESAIIKQSWLKLWPNSRPLPWFEDIVVVMDTAFREQQFDKKTFEADPTCCHVYGIFSHERRWNVMLLGRWSERIGFPELIRRSKQELRKTYGRRQEILFTPMIGQSMRTEQEKRPDVLLVEEKGSGISLRQMLSAEGIDSWPYNPGKADKLSRLHNVSHIAANGRIWLPESVKNPGEFRTWILPMLDEVCVYSGPGTTKHDDDVDCFSMGMRYFADKFVTAGVDGVIRLDTQVVNVSSNLVGEEWLEGEDMLPGSTYEEPFDNPYG